MTTAVRVWVIDDEPAVGFLFCTALREAGFAPERLNGAEALRRFDRGTDLPACIVTDLRMPNVTGNDILRRVRTLGAILPVVVVTGFSADIAADVRDVPKRVLEKPVLPSELVEAMFAVLNGMAPRPRHARPTAPVWWRSRQFGVAVIALLTALAVLIVALARK